VGNLSLLTPLREKRINVTALAGERFVVGGKTELYRLFTEPYELAHGAADRDRPFVAVCDPIRGDLGRRA
jgi:hypothetical protein